MNRSRLLNRYKNEKTEEAKKRFYVKLLRNAKKEFGNNLNVKYFTENYFKKP